MSWFRIQWVLVMGSLALAGAKSLNAGTFYYTGATNGSFFTESNWRSMPNGTGTSPLAGEIDPSIGIIHHLILDGDSVRANTGMFEGTLDIAAGGILELGSGSSLEVSNDTFSAQLEISTGGMLSVTDADIEVEDDVFIRGTTTFNGGSLTSFFDDIEILTSDLTMSNATFRTTDVSSGASSNIIVRAELTPAAGASITNSTFMSNSRFGIREFNMEVTDSVFTIATDLEDVFANDQDTATASLILNGNSSITVGQVQEGVHLVLNDTSIATLTNVPGMDPFAKTWFTQSTTVTLNTPDNQLILVNPQEEVGDTFIINGLTGLTYEMDSSTWNPTDWNGLDAVTLMITNTVPYDADFDDDDDVDGTDFLIWQRGFGLTGQPDNSTGDATGDGDVNGLDLAVWEAQFGSQPLSAISIVPEPSSELLLVCFGMILSMSLRRSFA